MKQRIYMAQDGDRIFPVLYDTFRREKMHLRGVKLFPCDGSEASNSKFLRHVFTPHDHARMMFRSIFGDASWPIYVAVGMGGEIEYSAGVKFPIDLVLKPDEKLAYLRLSEFGHFPKLLAICFGFIP